ncbi:MAG: hypothetical protein GX028_08615 [Clostridiaceae bacterium]|nr:hypothetical protein [Clostridiaceae bacterium]
MKRTKQIALAIMITACVLLLVWMCRPARADIDYTRYVAAARSIDAGKRLEAEDIVFIEMPTGSLPADYYTSPDQVIGLIAAIDLSEGDLLGSNLLQTRPQGLNYPFQTAGTRLMTIELPAGSANGYWLASGSKVDIDMIARSADEEQPVISLENIEVAAVLPAGGIGGTVEPGTVTGSGRSLICLALSRAEALQLADGLANRQICLSVICPD